jgi:sulfide:quinone oxidoreductase
MQKRILIVGAGTAGITVAAQLIKKLGQNVDITIFDPQETHYYQPMWTLVGAGVFNFEQSARPNQKFIPDAVNWVKQKVESFQPETKTLTTQDGSVWAYEYLIVASGIQLDWHKIKGMPEALHTDGVCSNYDPQEGASKTFKEISKLGGGRAIFTQPALPIKCAGAPQKAVYMSEDFWRSRGVRDSIEIIFANHGPRIFGVEKYKKALDQVIARKGIIPYYSHNLIEVRSETKEAVFENADKEQVVMQYDFLHVVPPQSAPDYIKKSPLADSAGWVEVDKFTLQHIRFEHVFSLGDCSSLPTSRTGAAVRKQVPVLVENISHHMKGESLEARYDGYTSCPLVTGVGSTILAEFDYDGNPTETFPFDQGKERWSMWILKAHLLPQLYWHGMLRGRA